MNMAAAIFIGAIALYLLLGGFRFARTATSLWGFVVGFLIGGSLASDMLHVGLLDARRSILLGLAVGILSALLAYLYYGCAVVILAGGIGYWLGSGSLLLLGFVPGAFSGIGGLAIGAACGSIALLTGLTRYVLIALTSIAGAVALVGSIMITLHKFNLELLSYISVITGATSSVPWLLATVAFTAAGILIQGLTTRGYECEKWALGTYVGNDRRRLEARTNR